MTPTTPTTSALARAATALDGLTINGLTVADVLARQQEAPDA